MGVLCADDPSSKTIAGQGEEAMTIAEIEKWRAPIVDSMGMAVRSLGQGSEKLAYRD
jgi:hypothetical protein